MKSNTSNMNNIKFVFQKQLFILCAAVFLAIFILSSFSPLVCDDYNYSYSLYTDEKIENLYDLKMSIVYHWEVMNGRFFSHLFAFFFLWQNKTWFNLANGLMAALLTMIISKYVSLGKGKLKAAMLCLALIFCFMPVWGQVFLWLDGACNYSWALVFTLAFLYPYCAAWFNTPVKFNIVSGILFIPFSFIAGAYLENGSLAVIGISLVLMAVMALKREQFSLWLIPSFLTACCGFYFMISAPSESKRGSLSIADAFNRLCSFIPELQTLYYILGALAIAVFIAVCILLRKNRKGLFYFLSLSVLAVFSAGFYLTRPRIFGVEAVNALCEIISSNAWSLLSITLMFSALLLMSIYFRIDRKVLFFSILLFLAGAGSIAVFLFARYLPARGFMHYVVFLSIASVLMVRELLPHLRSRIVKILGAGLCACSCICLLLGCSDIIGIHSISQARLNTIEQAKANGVHEVAVPALESKTKYSASFQLDDVKEDREAWPNPVMARYHGVEKIYRS